MNYNRRMSTARPGPTPGANVGRNQHYQQTRQQEEEPVIELSDSEIIECLGEIGLRFTIGELQKPNPTQIQKLYEYFAELLMNMTREVVAPAMRAAAEDVCGAKMDSISADTRDLIGLFAVLQQLMTECQITDFTLNDLYNPTYKRLTKILSYVINFIRFREQHTNEIARHLNKGEQAKHRIKQLIEENDEAMSTLHSLQRQQNSQEEVVRDYENRSNELKRHLLELRTTQEQLTEEAKDLKDKQAELKTELDDRTTKSVQIRQECDRLRPYSVQSPAVLESVLRDLREKFQAERAAVEKLEKRVHALVKSGNAFSAVTADVKKAINVLNEIESILVKEEEEAAKAIRHRDLLSERTNEVKDLELEERKLQHQISSLLEGTKNFRKGAQERNKIAQKRCAELSKQISQLKEQKGDRAVEIDRSRIRTEQFDQQIADLKKNLEAEIGFARDEYQKLESHVRLYISQMEQAINESDGNQTSGQFARRKSIPSSRRALPGR